MTSPAEPLPASESTEHVRDLVARGQQGDRDALEELYLIHFDRIYSYLHVSVGNRHDAEDLTTQTFLKMLEKIGSFKWQSAPFSAWLFRIAHNLAMDHFRARRRWQPEVRLQPPERGGGGDPRQDRRRDQVAPASRARLAPEADPAAGSAVVPASLRAWRWRSGSWGCRARGRRRSSAR
jgi:DNA-directed RNA polymerase specialized sigma24 family protein